ncbi:MAG: LytR C-terminal domain-containing protein [Ilumatobacteraceae bacterium]
MTESSDGHGERRLRRRSLARGDSRGLAPTLVLLVAAAGAVVAGFVILRSVTDQTVATGDSVAVLGTTTASTTPVSTIVLPTSTTTPATTTTAPSASKSDATVVVANASGVGGSATAMTAELVADGYTVAPVANSTGPELDQSIIYYLPNDAGALGVARLLAAQIPTAQTLPMPTVPSLDRPLGAATVALMLGRDAAGKPLGDPVPN